MVVERLSNAKVEGILNRTLTHRFSKEIAALVTAQSAFADRVYNDVYSKPDRDKMNALPKGWLVEATSMNVRIGGSSWISLDFDGKRLPSALRLCQDGVTAGTAITRPVKAVHNGRIAAVYEATHALAIRYEKLQQEKSSLESQVEEARSKLRSVLRSFTTVGGLLKAWPELAPFVAAPVATNAPNTLPAIPLAQLNELLNLPVKKVSGKKVPAKAG